MIDPQRSIGKFLDTSRNLFFADKIAAQGKPKSWAKKPPQDLNLLGRSNRVSAQMLQRRVVKMKDRTPVGLLKKPDRIDVLNRVLAINPQRKILTAGLLTRGARRALNKLRRENMARISVSDLRKNRVKIKYIQEYLLPKPRKFEPQIGPIQQSGQGLIKTIKTMLGKEQQSPNTDFTMPPQKTPDNFNQTSPRIGSSIINGSDKIIRK